MRSRSATRCCAGRFASTSRKSAGRSCGSTRAKKISPTSRWTPHCPTPSCRGRNPSPSSVPLQAGKDGRRGSQLPSPRQRIICGPAKGAKERFAAAGLAVILHGPKTLGICTVSAEMGSAEPPPRLPTYHMLAASIGWIRTRSCTTLAFTATFAETENEASSETRPPQLQIVGTLHLF